MDDFESKYQPELQSAYDNTKKPPVAVAAILGVVSGIIITLVVGLFVFYNIGRKAQSSEVIGKLKADDLVEGAYSNKLETIIAYINQFYYKDISADKLADGVYAGLVESLDDPYSQYYNAEEYKELMETLSGNYCGIGALLQKDKDTGEVSITKVYPDTPAEKSGLKEDDIIVSADGAMGIDEELEAFVQHIRGEKDTQVELVIRRGEEELTIKCTREEIATPTVEHKMLDDQIGYIAVSQFAESTYDDFVAAYEDLEKQGMKSVIFDMRDNGGGLLDSVVDILDYLLPKGVVVYTKDKNGAREDFESEDSTQKNIPAVVLVNGNTASAAEIFTGAVRDFKYGKIIGTLTFGKGIVQSTIPLGDGSAVKLTTQTYYTPSGECIHGKGIKPDIELEYESLGEEGEEYSQENDNQLQKAIEVLKTQ